MAMFMESFQRDFVICSTKVPVAAHTLKKNFFFSINHFTYIYVINKYDERDQPGRI